MVKVVLLILRWSCAVISNVLLFGVVTLRARVPQAIYSGTASQQGTVPLVHWKGISVFPLHRQKVK